MGVDWPHNTDWSIFPRKTPPNFICLLGGTRLPWWWNLWRPLLHYWRSSLLEAIIWTKIFNDDVIKWKFFPRYWPFVRGIHRSPVNSPHKGQWRGALMFSLAWMNDWVNNREAGALIRHLAHYDVTAMSHGKWRMYAVCFIWYAHTLLCFVLLCSHRWQQSSLIQR